MRLRRLYASALPHTRIIIAKKNSGAASMQNKAAAQGAAALFLNNLYKIDNILWFF